MKRFVICLDGTWQQLRQDKLTNIGIIARSVAHKTINAQGDHVEQVVLYAQGVGSNIDALGKQSFLASAQSQFNRLAGGAFGEGLEDGIVDVYLRLAFNYEKGDEIFIFGFSRGAFAARSLAGLINCAGIVSRMHADKAWRAFSLYRDRLPANATDDQKKAQIEEQVRFRMLYGKGERNADGSRKQTADAPVINFLGIFDTVGQRGVPSVFGGLTRLFNRRYGFHDLQISSNVLAARHALAIDEQRIGFPPTLWENLEDANARAGRTAFEQRWFIGSHGDIGGGSSSQLSATPLKWITDGAKEAGLRFYAKHGDDESPLEAAVGKASFEDDITRPNLAEAFLSPLNYPFAARKIWRGKTQPTRTDADAQFDVSVALRCEASRIDPRYRPKPLKPFRGALRQIAESVLPADEIRPPDKR